MTNKEDKNSFVKIVSMGPFDLDLTLALTEEQMIRFEVPDISRINTLADCKEFLIKAKNETKGEHRSLLDYIRVSSTNSSITTLLTVNKAFKKKTFIEYLVLSECLYNEEELFMKDIVKYVTEQNYLFVIENNLYEIPTNITFTIKNAETKDTNFIKTFNLDLQIKKVEQNQSSNLYENLNYDFEYCNFFFFDLNHIFKFIPYGIGMENLCEYIQNLTEKNKFISLAINYPNIVANLASLDVTQIAAIQDILSYTDVFIFEKSEALALFNILNSVTSKSSSDDHEKKSSLEMLFIKDIVKKRKNFPKIGIFFDEMKSITIIEQQVKSNLILFHSDFDLNLIPQKISNVVYQDYKKLLVVNHDELKFTILGGFFSRLFYKKSFNTCFTAGSESAKRILELQRFQMDYPSDNNFYLIRIKKTNAKKKEGMEEDFTKKKEQHFVLDCINIVNSKMKSYNPLYDSNLQSYFSSLSIRHHLKKLGFINKNGQILEDPEFNKLGLIKNKKLIKKYEDEQKKLVQIKDGNYKLKLQIKNLFQGAAEDIHNLNLNDLEKLSRVHNFHPISGMKLPSITGSIFNFANKSESSRKDDLYAQHVTNKRKDPFKDKIMNKKSLKPLSKENYLKLLENYEDKVKTNPNKEIHTNTISERNETREKEDTHESNKEFIDRDKIEKTESNASKAKNEINEKDRIQKADSIASRKLEVNKSKASLKSSQKLDDIIKTESVIEDNQALLQAKQKSEISKVNSKVSKTNQELSVKDGIENQEAVVEKSE
jgi:hypothetical protein